MFGFSLPKLAVLIAIVLSVWYGFKILGRRRVLNNQRANNVKEKKGKQKSISFSDKRVDSANGFRLSESRVAKTTRPIDRSLRTIVMDNRKQMKPAATDEEKGLQILAQGQ